MSRHAGLMRQLIALAHEEQHCLSGERWEDAVALRQRYDDLFHTLQRSVEATGFEHGERELLQELQSVHGKSVSLVTARHASVADELVTLKKSERISGYAPTGTGERAPRIFDEAA